MTFGALLRKALACAVAASMLAQPAMADTYFYFRGGAQTGAQVDKTPQVPGGAFSLVLDTPSPNVAVVGDPYRANAHPYSNIGPVTFSVASGSLPPGLALDASSGTISGTPTAAGPTSATIQGRDSGTGRTASAALSLETVARLSISGTPATTVPAGTAYAATFALSGGGAPYQFSSGALPPGLALSASGATATLSGTPSAAGSYPIRITGTESHGLSVAYPFELQVVAPLAVAGTPPATATVGTAYSGSFQATGGTAPFSWSLAAGSLPGGIVLDPATGVLSGAPTAQGTFAGIVVEVADAAGRSATAAPFSIAVSAADAQALTIAGNPVSIATEGIPYAVSGYVAGGGSGGYVFSVAYGSLPDGLTLDPSTGHISGTPAAGASETGNNGVAGLYDVQVQVADSAGSTALADPFTMEVGPAGPLGIGVSANSMFDGTVGSRFFLQLAGYGGSGGYTYALRSTSFPLPPGLTLDPATGLVSGYPTQEGEYQRIRFQVSDSEGHVASSPNVWISIYGPPPPLTISGAPAASATQWNSYSATFTGFDGAGWGYHFTSVGNSLPPGLSLSDVGGADGVLSGIPTVPGVYSGLKIQVVDGEGNVAVSQTFSIAVISSPVVIAGAPAAVAEIGQAYYAQFNATGGAGGNVYSLVSGSLPPGLDFYSSGLIYGWPTTEGAYSGLAVRVVDAAGEVSDTAPFAITVTTPSTLAVDGAAPETAATGTTYSAQYVASGGSGEGYAFSLATGQLPPGLSLNPATGAVSGAPTQAGVYPNVQVRLTDSLGATAFSAPSRIVVAGPIAVTGSAGPAATGVPYNAQFEASGGIAPYTWSVGGTLPAGLSIDAWGLIYGTPASGQDGIFSGLTAIATDARGTVAASAPFSIAVSTSEPLVVSGTGATATTVGTPYAAQFTATGGLPPYTWGIANDATLPPGIAIDDTGLLSGTPTMAGAALIIPLVQDAVGRIGTGQPFRLFIDEPAGKPLSVVTGTPPETSVGMAYGVSLKGVFPASGGSVPTILEGGVRYTYALAPGSAPLPAGLVLSETAIQGRATTAGTYGGIVLQVTDAGGGTVTTQPFAIKVNPGEPLTIAGTPVTTVTAFSDYNSQFVASGGTGPYTYELVTSESGLWWLWFPSEGLLSGTPANWAVGVHPDLVVKVTDALGATASTPPFTLTVLAKPVEPLTISGGPVAQAKVGTYYQDQGFSGHGGPANAQYLYELASGSLPPGLELSPGYGSIAGTPTTAGSYGPIRVAASIFPTETKVVSDPFWIIVTTGAGPITVAGATDVSAEVGSSYVQAIAAAGGAGAPYTVSLAPGSGPLPAGLSLANGRISGTPTYFDAYPGIVLRVADKDQNTVDTAPFTITINPAPLTITGTPPSEVGTEFDYDFQFTVKGGLVQTGQRTAFLERPSLFGRMFGELKSISLFSTPARADQTAGYRYRADNLPPGLSIDPETGRITGRPTNGNTDGTTVTVTDGTNTATSAPFGTKAAPSAPLDLGISFSYNGEAKFQPAEPKATVSVVSTYGGTFDPMEVNNVPAPRGGGYLVSTPTTPVRNVETKTIPGTWYDVIDDAAWLGVINHTYNGQVVHPGECFGPCTQERARLVMANGWYEHLRFVGFTDDEMPGLTPPSFYYFSAEYYSAYGPYNSPQAAALGVVFHSEKNPDEKLFVISGSGGLVINTAAAKPAGFFGGAFGGSTLLTVRVSVQGTENTKWSLTIAGASMDGSGAGSSEMDVSVNLHTGQVRIDRTDTPAPGPDPNRISVTSVKG